MKQAFFWWSRTWMISTSRRWLNNGIVTLNSSQTAQCQGYDDRCLVFCFCQWRCCRGRFRDGEAMVGLTWINDESITSQTKSNKWNELNLVWNMFMDRHFWFASCSMQWKPPNDILSKILQVKQNGRFWWLLRYVTLKMLGHLHLLSLEVKKLVTGQSPNCCDYDKRTPLHVAASKGGGRTGWLDWTEMGLAQMKRAPCTCEVKWRLLRSCS